MKLLLDTHIFLWFISENERLSDDVYNAIKHPETDVFLSVASIWECVIKYKLGKLNFPELPEIYLPKKRKQHLINSLVIDEGSISYLTNLPLLHKDPFDRLLICQSLQHDLVIVTEDQAILSYPNIKVFNFN
ncbi:MAG: type II toxin-antitoxin system VapC family toxin [Gomphosphaeria aponina SAG 52.96 = DSM 107014]|uniref:Type II toxin-antitoxin system VapC family toxin n=1 Tax=Gomphosphaeria aponina SAG 52.96 = DSM 107014 TaxID=1521640 RepID=A0A941JTW5_9CHRO|nr:type II toxin-antitoxin system VapC family toxin [Gomphosphaeria aponina SAG 52.96 = DSM 107014]